MNIAPPQIISVEASAGSGKTYILAKRYIKLIFDLSRENYKNPASSILAVTFTNKAALEMKERIFDLLKKIALDRFDNNEEKEDLICFLGYEFCWLKDKACQLIDDIILNFSFFRMQTIDSFMHDIISASAFKANLSKEFLIKDDPTQYISYCLDNLLINARTSKAEENVFGSFIRQYMDIENKSSWFIKDNILSAIKVMFVDSNNYLFDYKKSNLKTSTAIVKKRKISLLLKNIQKEALKNNNKKLANSISTFLQKTEKGIFNIDDFPASIANECADSQLKICQELIKGLEEVSDIEAFSIFNSYIDIFSLARKNIIALEGKNNFLFLSELAKKTARIFDDGFITPPEIYLKLSSRFKHYLIDEFQDTSVLQLNNFLPLFEEALSYGGSIFYVSDPKQSLYRFRGAGPALSQELTTKYRAFKSEKILLNKNYRSQKNIVEFNNKLFSVDNLKKIISKISLENDLLKDNLEDIVDRFKNSYSDFKRENNAGRVKIDLIENTSEMDIEDIIKEKVMALIKKLSNNIDLDDIALICRTNNEVELVSDWLLENNISVESEKTLNIKRNCCIKEIVSFCRFLNSPSDNISFSSFLLGNIFANSSLISREEIEKFIYGCRNKKKEFSLYHEFKSTYLNASNLINEFKAQRDNDSIYEFTLKFLKKYNVFKNCSDSWAYLIKYLEIILKYECEYTNISSFLKFFDALEQDIFLNAKNSNAIKVLTSHKSKGLEFGAVIIPFLKLGAKLGLSHEGVHYHIDTHDGVPRLLYLKKAYANYSDDFKKIYFEEYAKSLGDELNSIYVALTRAKNELYCFVPEKNGRSRNLFLDILPLDNIDLGEERNYKREENSPVVSLKTANFDVADISQIVKENIDPSVLINRHEILRGDTLHLILSSIGILSIRNYKETVNAAIQNAYPRYNRKELVEYKKIVLKIICSKNIRRFFFIEEFCHFGRVLANNITIYTEKEIISKNGGLKRIDRLIVFKNEVWIIDFKSSKDDYAAHLKQVEEYKEIVGSLYPNYLIKGFIVYLDNGEVGGC